MSEISRRRLCSQRVALWCHIILKQTAATASDERVGVKKLEAKIKRDSQVTKSQAVFRRHACFCSGHLIDFSLIHHICCVKHESHNLTVSNYYLIHNHIKGKIIKPKWHGKARLMLRELTLGPGGPTRPAAPGKPVAPWKINSKLVNRKGKKNVKWLLYRHLQEVPELHGRL